MPGLVIPGPLRPSGNSAHGSSFLDIFLNAVNGKSPQQVEYVPLDDRSTGEGEGGRSYIWMYLGPRPTTPGAQPMLLAGGAVMSEGKAQAHVGDIILASRQRMGTPPGKETLPSNQAQVKIANLSIAADQNSGTLSGIGTFVLEDQRFSQYYDVPLRIPFGITTTVVRSPVDLVLMGRGKAHYGGAGELANLAEMDFNVKLTYDTSTFARAKASSAAAEKFLDEAKVSTAEAKKLANELKHPEIDVSGVVRFAIIRKIPIIKSLLRTKCHMRVSAQQPLGGAEYRCFGVIPIPPGGLFDVLGGGWGITSGKVSLRSRTSLTASVTPVPLPPFPIYLYGDFHKTWQLPNGIEVGVRLTLAFDQADLDKLRSDPRSLVLGREAPAITEEHPLQERYLQSRFLPGQQESRENASYDYKKPWVMGRLELKF